jgi:hypothetical protein
MILCIGTMPAAQRAMIFRKLMPDAMNSRQSNKPSTHELPGDLILFFVASAICPC